MITNIVVHIAAEVLCNKNVKNIYVIKNQAFIFTCLSHPKKYTVVNAHTMS